MHDSSISHGQGRYWSEGIGLARNVALPIFLGMGISWGMGLGEGSYLSMRNISDAMCG